MKPMYPLNSIDIMVQATFPLLFLQMEHLPRRLQHETRWGFPDDGGECHFSAWRTGRHGGYWEHWWFWRSLDSSTSQDSWHTFSFFYQCWQLAFTPFTPFLLSKRRWTSDFRYAVPTQKEMLQLSSIWVFGLPIDSSQCRCDRPEFFSPVRWL